MCKIMRKIKMDDYELRIIIRALNEMRNQLIREKKDTDVIDELLLKYIGILEK